MAKTLFDHLNAIYQDQSLDYYDKLEEGDRKTYSQYMLNRFMSMNPSYTEAVNEINKYSGLMDNRTHYLFFAKLLPKGKQFNKYIKPKNKSPHSVDVVLQVSRHFQVSADQAEEYLDLCSADVVIKFLESYGWDKKAIKKAGYK